MTKQKDPKQTDCFEYARLYYTLAHTFSRVSHDAYATMKSLRSHFGKTKSHAAMQRNLAECVKNNTEDGSQLTEN